jgi:hypothetical protein
LKECLETSLGIEVRECFQSCGAEFLSNSLLAKNINSKTYRSIIFLVVLCGCETWSLTQREERRLRMFENRVLRRICGFDWDGVKEEWRRLHKEEVYDLYSLPNSMGLMKSRRM